MQHTLATKAPASRPATYQAVMSLAEEEPRIWLDDVIYAVEVESGVRRAEFCSPRRFVKLTRIRHVLFYVATKKTKASSVLIGRRLGGRDHSTVLHGVMCVAANPDRFEPLLSRVLARLEARK
jgi:chromosomal replication initiation ATPase DnaA